jgi:hypothetical protein
MHIYELFVYIYDIYMSVICSFLKILNFMYVFEMKIYYHKTLLYNTIIYKKCAQRVNVRLNLI